MCYCPTPTLHLNLALTGDGAFLFSLKKTHSVRFISVLNYGDTENVLINHLLLVIPMSYPCHYTNLCPHKPHKHAYTHTHTHTHTHTPSSQVCLSISLHKSGRRDQCYRSATVQCMCMCMCMCMCVCVCACACACVRVRVCMYACVLVPVLYPSERMRDEEQLVLSV